MSRHWPKVRLGEVLAQNTDYVDAPESREYPKLSVKLYGKGVVLDTPADGALLKMKRHQLAKAGQVILSEIWGKKGAIGFVPTECEGALCTSHFFLFDVARDRIEPAYLDLILKANFLEEQLGSGARGTTGYAAVRPKHLLACEIPLPPLAEQRRIVARIEELAAQIHEARALRQQAANETEALLASARNSLIGEVPKPTWIPLNCFVETIENGKSPQCEARPANNDEWGVLKVGAVSFGTFDERENKALPASIRAEARYEVRPDDFLMSRANTTELVGACAIVQKSRPKLLLSDKIFRFRFREGIEVEPSWLDHAMKAPILRDQITRAASGTSPTMKNISKEKVLGLLLPPHSLQEQRRIVAELDALLPAILDRAFRGEL